MWRLRLRGALLLFGALLESTLGQRVGFYAPQYELLDPRTGRSVSQGFKIIRQPILEQRSLSTDAAQEDYSSSSSGRPERDASSFFSGYFKPEGFKFPAFASIRSAPDDFHSSPTYFTQDRERSDRDVSAASSEGFVRPSESSGFFSSDQSEPNFFRMFGSGFKNGPSPLPEKYRFTRHSFPEYSRQPTQSPSRSKRRPAGNRFTFKSFEEPISNELAVAKSPERYSSASDALDSNNFNGDFAHKWRKKYPYYGRRKRSAEPMYAPWAILDPLTGRPRESREGSSASSSSGFTQPSSGFGSSSIGSSDIFFSRDSIPSQFLETHNRDERFNFNFRPTGGHRGSSSSPQRQPFQQQEQRPKSQYLNYAGRPKYKTYRKNPYYG